jgi:hypothetical protein
MPFLLSPCAATLFMEGNMTTDDYNYASFKMQREMGKFTAFQDLALHTGRRAPDFPFEDLETGQTVNLMGLCDSGLVIIEFGSYT